MQTHIICSILYGVTPVPLASAKALGGGGGSESLVKLFSKVLILFLTFIAIEF